MGLDTRVPPPTCGSCSGGANDPWQAEFLFCGSELRLPTARGFILDSSQPAGPSLGSRVSPPLGGGSGHPRAQGGGGAGPPISSFKAKGETLAPDSPAFLILGIGERGSGAVWEAGPGSWGTSAAPVLCVARGSRSRSGPQRLCLPDKAGTPCLPFRLCLSKLSWFLGFCAAPSSIEGAQNTGHLSRGRSRAGKPPMEGGAGGSFAFGGGSPGKKAAGGVAGWRSISGRSANGVPKIGGYCLAIKREPPLPQMAT